MSREIFDEQIQEWADEAEEGYEPETLLGVVTPPQVEELDLFPEGVCCDTCTCGGSDV